MGVEWYDMIAKRNGGYKSKAVYTTEGISAEVVFEERLVRMLFQYNSVLDAGCGHGEFTLKMARHTNKITGLDNSTELLKIADSLLDRSGVNNVDFVYATTKTKLPFANEQFDLIYDRRGPTSIINHPRILSSGGLIFGIHTSIDAVEERLKENKYTQIEIEEFNSAINYFPNKEEFAKFLSDVPGFPDYTAPEHNKELELKIQESTINGRLCIREQKYIWKAIKP
jgi:SAM-dependent methyltransferase